MENLKAQIAAKEKELNVRLAAANHLGGIPKVQNQTRIDYLYDELCDLNLLALEAA